MAIINGRKLELVDRPVRGKEIIDAADSGTGRRLVMVKGRDYELVEPERSYSPLSLCDSNGDPITISSIPDRTKGGL